MGSQLLEEGTSDSGEDGIRWEIDRADGGGAVGGLDPEQRPTGTGAAGLDPWGGGRRPAGRRNWSVSSLAVGREWTGGMAYPPAM